MNHDIFKYWAWASVSVLLLDASLLHLGCPGTILRVCQALVIQNHKASDDGDVVSYVFRHFHLKGIKLL